MNIPRLTRSAALPLAALLAAAPISTALAQSSYPDRAIRLVVPFPPGAATDSVARLTAKSMSDYLKQTIVVENKGGAGATIGAAFVANSAPDGYTLLATTQGVHVINPAIYPTLPYHPVTSFAPVGHQISTTLALSVLKDAPFKTLKEVIAHAKKHPGELSYASAGQGSSLNVGGELLKHYADVDLLHVPYRGGGPAMQDFLAGRTTLNSTYYASIKPHYESGAVRILAVGSPKRFPFLPDIPTVAELGYPEYNSDTWTGIVAPAGTPAGILDKLNKALNYAMEQNRAALEKDGYTVLGGTRAQMQKTIETEHKQLTPLLKTLLEPAATK